MKQHVMVQSASFPDRVLTDGAKVRVRHGEAIRTQYEIPAPFVNTSEVFTDGAGI
jgi:hypothetical protein